MEEKNKTEPVKENTEPEEKTTEKVEEKIATPSKDPLLVRKNMLFINFIFLLGLCLRR